MTVLESFKQLKKMEDDIFLLEQLRIDVEQEESVIKHYVNMLSILNIVKDVDIVNKAEILQEQKKRNAKILKEEEFTDSVSVIQDLMKTMLVNALEKIKKQKEYLEQEIKEKTKNIDIIL